MRGQSVLDATYAALLDVGEDATLTRISGRTGSTRKTVTVKGRLLNADSDPMLGDDVDQTGRRFILSNREIAVNNWPGPPRDGDELKVQGKTYVIESVKTFAIGSMNVRHELYLKG